MADQSLRVTFAIDMHLARALYTGLRERQEKLVPDAPCAEQMELVQKLAVLEQLLNEGEVDTWVLAQRLAEQFGTEYDTSALDSACVDIMNACATSGTVSPEGTKPPGTGFVN
jgi:hypothetical protein